MTLNGAVAQYPDPRFEGFAIQTAKGTGAAKVRQAVARTLGQGWEVHRFGDDPHNFEITRPDHPLPVAEAWAATYRLRAQAGVLYAEPVFAVAISGRPDW